MLKYCLWVDARDAEGIRAMREALAAARCSYEYTELVDSFNRLDHVSFAFTGKIQMRPDGLLIGKAEKPVGYDRLMEFWVTDECPQEFRHLPLPCRCPVCGAPPAWPHSPGCDVERCSACGGQRLVCDCEGHDPLFARWTGFWPGQLEATALGTDLNELAESGLGRLFTVKPPSHEKEEI